VPPALILCGSRRSVIEPRSACVCVLCLLFLRSDSRRTSHRHDTNYRAGFQRKRLHRVEFIPSDDPNAFGFLDPDEVVRAAHLIPVFYHGGTESLLQGLSVARDEGEVDDWRYFYVNL
jgi:hypothetical protein